MVTLIIFKFSVPIPRTNCFKLVSIKKIDKLLQRQKKHIFGCNMKATKLIIKIIKFYQQKIKVFNSKTRNEIKNYMRFP